VDDTLGLWREVCAEWVQPFFGDTMKTGSIVYAKYPRKDGDGMGIILEYKKGGAHHFGIIPSRAKVRWALTGKENWYKVWDLELVL
jgi:hypothetical protein